MSCCSGNKSTSNTSLADLTSVLDKLIEAKLSAKVTGIEARLKELETTKSKLDALVAQAQSSAQVAQDAKQHLMGVVDQCNEIARLMAEKLADGFNVNGEFVYNGKTYKFKHGIIVEVK